MYIPKRAPKYVNKLLTFNFTHFPTDSFEKHSLIVCKNLGFVLLSNNKLIHSIIARITAVGWLYLKMIGYRY